MTHNNRYPIRMVLHCPKCTFQHIDAPDPCLPSCARYHGQTFCDCHDLRWSNPPHATHLCKACGYLWKPSNWRTEGVQELPKPEDELKAIWSSNRIMPDPPSMWPKPYPGTRIRDAVTGRDLGPAD